MSGMHCADDLVVYFDDINGHVGRQGVHGVGQINLEGRMLLEFFMKKDLCDKYMAKERDKYGADNQTGRKTRRRKKRRRNKEERWKEKLTVLVRTEHKQFIQNVKVILFIELRRFQHELVIADINKMKKESSERRKISLLKDEIRK